MSIIDFELRFMDGQSEATADVSENVYDRGADASDPAVLEDMIAGRPMYLEINIPVSWNTLTSIDVDFVSSAAAGLTSPRVHCTRNLLLAQLVAGAAFVIGVPAGAKSLRFLGVIVTQNGTPATAGTISARLVTDVQQNPPV